MPERREQPDPEEGSVISVPEDTSAISAAGGINDFIHWSLDALLGDDALYQAIRRSSSLFLPEETPALDVKWIDGLYKASQHLLDLCSTLPTGVTEATIAAARDAAELAISMEAFATSMRYRILQLNDTQAIGSFAYHRFAQRLRDQTGDRRDSLVYGTNHHTAHVEELLSAAADGNAGALEATGIWLAWIAREDLACRYPRLARAWNACQAAHRKQAVAAERNALEQAALPQLLTELDGLVGLESIKAEVRTVTNTLRIQQHRADQGLPTKAVSRHMVFSGPPGTGKTTVARLLGRIFRALGLLKGGHLIEVSRQDMVAEYVGQTAPKANGVIDRALDGVLFIDEAYSLTPGASNDFGSEAIEVLLKRMEDDRKRLVVIVAGYTDEMKGFLEANPGLASRFGQGFTFESYAVNDLVLIFDAFCQDYGYELDAHGREQFRELVKSSPARASERFGNARAVRNYLERAIDRQANRLAQSEQPSRNELITILPDDLPATFGDV